MDGNDETTRVILELQAGSGAMQGTVEHRDGTREGFWGWLELMATLERVAAHHPQHDTNDRRQEMT